MKLTGVIFHPAAMTSGSYSSSSGVYMGEDSSGGGDALGRFLDIEGYGSGGGGGGGLGGGGAGSSSSYMVSSVSKVKSSSSSGGGGARRAVGSSGGPSPSFRERKTVTSHSGGYDGETPMSKNGAWFGTVDASSAIMIITMMVLMKSRKWRRCMRVPLTFCARLCFFVLGSSSANSSPELTRKDYGIYCKCDCRLRRLPVCLAVQCFPSFIPSARRCWCGCVRIYVFPPSVLCTVSAGSSATRGRSESRGTWPHCFPTTTLSPSHPPHPIPTPPPLTPHYCCLKASMFFFH